MKVTLVKCTTEALDILLFTKSTRLQMSSTSLDSIRDWTVEKKLQEWKYMQDTIKSSWEFIDYIFLIEGVTRAFTQQLERHRIGTSFAEQSLRTVDASEFEFLNTCKSSYGQALTKTVVREIKHSYGAMIEEGEKPEDARGILPLNIKVNIIFKANLRALNAMCAERLCFKAQGEFQQVMQQIRNEVIEHHCWTEPVLRVHCAQTGVCCFPRFATCPIKNGIFNPETGKRYDEKSYDWKVSHDDGSSSLEVINVRPLTKQQIQEAWEAEHK